MRLFHVEQGTRNWIVMAKNKKEAIHKVTSEVPDLDEPLDVLDVEPTTEKELTEISANIKVQW